MKELKCPQCGTAFSVDEDDYASIVNQVKNIEFEKELQRRTQEMEARRKAEQETLQVQNQRELERSKAESQRKLDLSKAESALQLSEKEQEIARLREQLQSASTVTKMEMQSEIAKREQQITKLQSQLDAIEGNTKVAIMAEQTKSMQALSVKDSEIAELRNQLHTERESALVRERSLDERHKAEMRSAMDQIEFYRDMRNKLSTKMVGETLEEHCRTEYELKLRPHMPTATFVKDNEVADHTKGDFIFRIYDDGMEYLSIMFEMKNESEESVKKRKNEEHLKKLDADRRKKGCEYAVLVSTLEADSELYNTGIVDKSHLYEKMYVVRPQFFVPIITMLTQAAQKSISYQRQLIEARSQSIDITNFEGDLQAFKEKFGRNFRLASERFADAIKAIDESIASLQETKAQLLVSEKHLKAANNQTDELTIAKLTKNNPTMARLLEEARAKHEASYEVVE